MWKRFEILFEAGGESEAIDSLDEDGRMLVGDALVRIAKRGAWAADGLIY